MTDPSIVCWVLELEIERYKDTIGYNMMKRESKNGWWPLAGKGTTAPGQVIVYALEAGLHILREKTKKHTAECYRLRNLFTGDIIMGDAC